MTKKNITEPNIFDLEDIRDLPPEIAMDLRRYDTFFYKLLELFAIANRDLTVEELTAGYYRTYGEIKTKKQIMAKLYTKPKSKDGKIRIIKKGKYYGVEEK